MGRRDTAICVVLVVSCLVACKHNAQSEPPAPDLAWSSCMGTAIAGTCVEEYFDEFAACFQPAGRCYASYGDLTPTACWDDGARFSQSYDAGRYYSMRDHICLMSATSAPCRTSAGHPIAVTSCCSRTAAEAPFPSEARFMTRPRESSPVAMVRKSTSDRCSAGVGPERPAHGIVARRMPDQRLLPVNA
jgi:hypothetical protein